MKIRLTFILLALIAPLMSGAQYLGKITGPLGVYDMAEGYSYSDSSGIDSILMQSEFEFGEINILNAPGYFDLRFQNEIDTCNQWHANRLFGIVVPPSEGGVGNQPTDTALYAPAPMHHESPGMIQGAVRFSRLSTLYGGYSGVILDDWDGDTAVTHQVRDAVQGKYVDDTGKVYSETMATTPDNKVYCVLYGTDPIPAVMPYMDGLYYSLVNNQNCCYTQIDSDIDQLQANFPHKELMIAIFLQNSHLGWLPPASVQYMLAHLLDRYDNGDINQVNIFAAIYLLKQNISIGLWDSMALPHWLDSLYYPYLGAGQGTAYDCNDGSVLPDVSVRMYCTARTTGDTLMRSYQRSDANGHYNCGLWAGNRNTDSTYYRLVAKKTGYINDTAGFWIKRGATTTIPDIYLCPGVPGSSDKLILFPNPATNACNVVVTDSALNSLPVTVFDELGRRVMQFMTVNGYADIDISTWGGGLYYFKLSGNVKKLVKE